MLRTAEEARLRLPPHYLLSLLRSPRHELQPIVFSNVLSAQKETPKCLRCDHDPAARELFEVPIYCRITGTLDDNELHPAGATLVSYSIPGLYLLTRSVGERYHGANPPPAAGPMGTANGGGAPPPKPPRLSGIRFQKHWQLLVLRHHEQFPVRWWNPMMRRGTWVRVRLIPNGAHGRIAWHAV